MNGRVSSEREDTLLDLFIHPGWKLLIAEMREAHQHLIETAYLVPDEAALHRRKGEIQKLSELLSFETVTRMQLEEDEEIHLDEAL